LRTCSFLGLIVESGERERERVVEEGNSNLFLKALFIFDIPINYMFMG
jgi:hypothetical protein